LGIVLIARKCSLDKRRLGAVLAQRAFAALRVL
jgi:hypothetical protein